MLSVEENIAGKGCLCYTLVECAFTWRQASLNTNSAVSTMSIPALNWSKIKYALSRFGSKEFPRFQPRMAYCQ